MWGGGIRGRRNWGQEGLGGGRRRTQVKAERVQVSAPSLSPPCSPRPLGGPSMIPRSARLAPVQLPVLLAAQRRAACKKVRRPWGGRGSRCLAGGRARWAASGSRRVRGAIGGASPQHHFPGPAAAPRARAVAAPSPGPARRLAHAQFAPAAELRARVYPLLAAGGMAAAWEGGEDARRPGNE